MADVDEHKNAKPAPQHEDTHADLHRDEKSATAIPDRHETSDHSKDANSSLADKVSGELSSADWRNVGNRFSGTGGMEARSILSMNPLANQTDRALDAGKKSSTAVLDSNFNFDSFSKGFSDFLHQGSDQKQGWFGDQMKGFYADPFSNGRPVDSLSQMGMPVRDLGGTGVFTPEQINGWGVGRGLQANHESISFWGESILEKGNLSYDENGKVALGRSVANSFIKDTMKDQQADQGIWNSIKDGAKSLWNKVAETGSELLDLGKKAGNATIEFVGIGAGIEHNTLGGKVQTSVDGDKTVFTRPGEKITLGPADKNGKHDASITTADGRTMSQDTNGVVTMKGEHSDLTAQRDKNGHVQVLDKSGTKITEFNSEGEARRFFENSITQVAKPGQSLDDAYNEYMKSKPKDLDKDHPDHLAKPILLMDGKGETLTVQPDGSRLYTHKNGDVDAIYKHIDRHGRERDIEVKIQDGKMTLGQKGGQQWDCDSKEAKDLMQDSRLRLDDRGQVQVNQDTSGDPRRAAWQRMWEQEQHRLHMFQGGELDTQTGKITIDDPKVHAEYTTDKDSGVIVETETKRNPDGTLDAHPSSVTTIDPEHAKVTLQELDPATGQPKPGVDPIRVEKGELDWMGMHAGEQGADITGPDGDKITLDQNGDIHGEDKDGNHFVDTKNGEASYDGGHSYSDQRAEYYRQEEVHNTQHAIQTATIVDANANALIARTDISASEVDALDQLLSQAVSNLPSNSQIPQQVVNARATLAMLKARLSNDQSVDQRTISASGQANGTLRDYARQAGNVGSDAAANYALERYGLKKKEQKDKPE